MNKKTGVFSSLLLLSLILSSLALYRSWINEPQQTPEKDSFSVTVNCGAAYYRLYVLCNSQSVVADENIGIHLYSFQSLPGKEIEIRAYANHSFTVDFAQESPHAPIERQTGTEISVSYTVPS